MTAAGIRLPDRIFRAAICQIAIVTNHKTRHWIDKLPGWCALLRLPSRLLSSDRAKDGQCLCNHGSWLVRIGRQQHGVALLRNRAESLHVLLSNSEASRLCTALLAHGFGQNTQAL